MSESIVVGVSGAPAARRALEWATRRAVQRRQGLVLLAVVEGVHGVIGEAALVDEVRAQTQQVLDDAAAFAREAGAATVETRIEEGKAVDRLIAASEGAGLLVIGSDYQGPYGGRVRGPHGLRIVTAAHCPVVVIPDVDVAERSGVVVGVDGSPASEAAVAFAAAEADRLGEKLIAVSAWVPLSAPRNSPVYPADYLEALEDATAESLALALGGLRSSYPDLEIESRVERGYPAAVLLTLSESASLTVVGTHGRGPVARFILGSVSHEVLQRIATVTAVVR